MTTDERMGKPSASGIERLSLCSGSWNLERTLPPLPETEDAATGTRIHRALELDDATGLSDEETWVYDRCRELYEDAISIALKNERPFAEYREMRLWLKRRFSGKLDRFALLKNSTLPNVGVATDFKTGRNDVTTADGNLQVRAQLVVANEFRELETGFGVIIQPWASEKISLAEYTREDLARAREWLVGVLDAADKPDAPRIPGEKQCRWCRAKYYGVCEEARSLALHPSNVVSIATESTEPKEIARRLDPRVLGSFLASATFAIDVIDACRDEAKRRLTAGEEVPGWKLKEGAVREVIVDVQTVYERFIEKGGGSATFMPCVEVKKGRLKDQLKAITGAKGKSLDAELEDVLAGCVEEKQNAPSLERVKGTNA